MLDFIKSLFLGKRVMRKKHVAVTEDMKDYMHTEFEKETSQKDIAKILNLSPSTVSRYYRKYLEEIKTQINIEEVEMV